VVHNGVVRSANKVVRQSVSLPSDVAAKVRDMAKTRRLSANRILLELIENGIKAEKSSREICLDSPELGLARLRRYGAKAIRDESSLEALAGRECPTREPLVRPLEV